MRSTKGAWRQVVANGTRRFEHARHRRDAQRRSALPQPVEVIACRRQEQREQPQQMWIMKRHFNRQLTIIGNRRSPEPFRHGAVRPLPTNGCFCVRNAACADPRFLVLTCFYQFFFNRTTAPAFSLSFSCVLSSCAWMASSIRSCSEGEMPAGWGRPSPSCSLSGRPS